jgi:hypothetical protein
MLFCLIRIAFISFGDWGRVGGWLRRVWWMRVMVIVRICFGWRTGDA